MHRFISEKGKLTLPLKSEIEIYNCGNMLTRTMEKKEFGKRETVVVNNSIEIPNRLIQFPAFMVQRTSSIALRNEVGEEEVSDGETMEVLPIRKGDK